MQKSKRQIFPALLLSFLLFFGGFLAGRGSLGQAVLLPDSVPPTEAARSAPPPAAASETGDRAGRLDLNRASFEELMALPGIGPVLAQRILDYREAHGAFQDTIDLLDIDGIGAGIYAGLKDSVYVEDSHEDSNH